MSYEVVILNANNDNHTQENNSNYLLIIFILIIAIIGVLVFTPVKQSVTHETVRQSEQLDVLLNWRLPEISNNDNLLNWKLPVNITTTKYSKTKVPPQDVIAYARRLAIQFNIVPAVILGACYHERMLLNWYDDFACGFGAISNNRRDWKAKYSGWQRQMRLFAKRANRCNMFRSLPNVYNAQMFAKNCYKTEAWRNYSKVANYTKIFNRYF